MACVKPFCLKGSCTNLFSPTNFLIFFLSLQTSHTNLYIPVNLSDTNVFNNSDGIFHCCS